jgi:hypothetical protein
MFNMEHGVKVTSLRATAEANDSIGKIADIIKEQFDLKPKEQTCMYQRPYRKWFGRVFLPPQCRVPDFMKFSSSDNVSTIEHVS